MTRGGGWRAWLVANRLGASRAFHKPNADRDDDDAHVGTFYWYQSMNNTTKVFQLQKNNSASELPRPLTEQERDRQSLLEHLQNLVKADPKEARAAMEMSPEHLPEPYLIAQNQFPREWATALMNSDSMHSLLSRNPNQAKELLKLPDLESLLGKMT
jgi:hypothetical protein